MIVSQMCAVAVSGLCFRGWMLYPTLVFGTLQNITEPCLQAVMATFVGADRQGGLQVRYYFSFISYDTPTFIVPILDERVQYFVVCQNSGLAAVLSLFSCMEINGGRSRLRLWLVESCLGLPVSRASRARCVDWFHGCSAVKVILSLFRAALNDENLEGCM